MTDDMDTTASTAATSADSLDHLSATYMDLTDVMGDVSQTTEDTTLSIYSLTGSYLALKQAIGVTTDEEEEQEVQTGFLASSFFFLASTVGNLILQYTALGGMLTSASGLMAKLGAMVKWLTGLTLSSWAMKAGAALKSGVLWVLRGLVSVGSTLLGWGTKFVSWLAAGSSGALAFGAAIGFIIGMLGVWILEITGVLDWIRTLGKALGTDLPGWARDGLIAVVALFTGWLAVLGGLVVGFIEGGFSGAWKRASEVVSIFAGSFERTFGRVMDWAQGVVSSASDWWTQWKRDSLDAVDSFIDSALSMLSSFSSNMGQYIANGFKEVFNSIIPSRIQLPELSVGGRTIGGQSIGLPQLEEGGMVEETGIARVHEGETYIPRDVRQDMGGGEGTAESKSLTVNVGGIDLGDQSLDLSNMSTMELNELAQKIAEKLGTEVDTLV
jgi:hypothetical protein